MRATRRHLTIGAAGLSAALLLLAACGESDQASEQGTVAPAAGNQEPAATPTAPATEGTTNSGSTTNTQ
jgi:ABC-type oligopeptide transport system substrate-binding subunit